MIYYEDNQIHSMELGKALQTNYWKGGMKKVLDKEMPTKSNYASTARICVSGSSATKATFWPEMLETSGNTGSDEIWSRADDTGKL